MELNEIRKYFYEDLNDYKTKNFVIRIRENEDIIYYNGIKIFVIKDNALKISDNIFKISDAYINEHKEELSSEHKRKNTLKALAKLRLNLFNAGYLECNKNMLIKYIKSEGNAYQSRKSEVAKNKDIIISKIEKKLKELKETVKLNSTYKTKSKNSGFCCLIKNELRVQKNDNDKVKLDKMLDILTIEYFVMDNFINTCGEWEYAEGRIKNKNGWKKPDVAIFDNKSSISLNKLTFEELEKIVQVMKNAVNDYLKTSFEVEKYYQHQFMTNKLVLKQFEKLGIKGLYRFEEEYYTFNSEDRGRIDSVFVSMDGKDVYLIELKVNGNVVDGSNGIHKHLIDIESLYEQKEINNFLRKMQNNINYRRKALGENKINFVKNMNVHYWIIIAYGDKKERDKIKAEKLNKYKTIEGLKGIKRVIEKKNGYKDKVLTLPEHILNLENYDCDVRIYFDSINYEKKMITLKGNKFEPYYVKENK